MNTPAGSILRILKQVVMPASIGALIGFGLSHLRSSESGELAFWATVGLVIGLGIELCLSSLYWLLVTRSSPSGQMFLRRYALAGLWLVAIPIFLWGGSDAQASFQAWYGDVQPYPVWGVVENIVLSGLVTVMLYGIIRPWSFQYSLNRLTISLLIFLGWFIATVGVIIDPPGFQTAQVVWQLFVILVLLIALVLTVRGLKQRSKRMIYTHS